MLSYATVPEHTVFRKRGTRGNCGDVGAAAALLLERTGVLGGDEEVGSGRLAAGLSGLLAAPDEDDVASGLFGSFDHCSNGDTRS